LSGFPAACTPPRPVDYGPLPGHGQHLDLRGVGVMEMEGDLIREERVYWNTGTLMAAAGML
jgi:hypothetical protein